LGCSIPLTNLCGGGRETELGKGNVRAADGLGAEMTSKKQCDKQIRLMSNTIIRILDFLPAILKKQNCKTYRPHSTRMFASV
jgi:hypothetical protein